jgi:hypothetical protein
MDTVGKEGTDCGQGCVGVVPKDIVARLWDNLKAGIRKAFRVMRLQWGSGPRVAITGKEQDRALIRGSPRDRIKISVTATPPERIRQSPEPPSRRRIASAAVVRVVGVVCENADHPTDQEIVARMFVWPGRMRRAKTIQNRRKNVVHTGHVRSTVTFPLRAPGGIEKAGFDQHGAVNAVRGVPEIGGGEHRAPGVADQDNRAIW